MGVQGARELMRRRAGEPQRLLKNRKHSGLKDKARMSHEEGEHAVMGGGSAQLPVRI
jgi:hypothetical protein